MKYNTRKLDSQHLTVASFPSPLSGSLLWLLVVSLKIRGIIFLHFCKTYQLIKTKKKNTALGFVLCVHDKSINEVLQAMFDFLGLQKGV